MDDISAQDLLAAAKRRTSSISNNIAADTLNGSSKHRSSSAEKPKSSRSNGAEIKKPASKRNSLTLEDLSGDKQPFEEEKKAEDSSKPDDNNNNSGDDTPEKEPEAPSSDVATSEEVDDEDKKEESAAVSEDEEDHEDDEEDSEEEESDDEEEEEKELDTTDLLAAVRGRMEQQRFMDEVKELKEKMERKDKEIETLNGQLQMAISTKHSLLVANADLEQRHEKDLQQSQQFEEDLQIAGRVHMDIRAEIEKDFLNDLARMAQKLHDVECEASEKEDKICKLEAQLTQKRCKDLEDGHACLACEEKTQIIAALQEKVHKLERIAPRQETSKVRFYKKKLGLA